LSNKVQKPLFGWWLLVKSAETVMEKEAEAKKPVPGGSLATGGGTCLFRHKFSSLVEQNFLLPAVDYAPPPAYQGGAPAVVYQPQVGHQMPNTSISGSSMHGCGDFQMNFTF
jgi:hypothetical protein